VRKQHVMTTNRGSGSTAPHIPDFSTLPLLCIWYSVADIHYKGSWVNPRAGLDVMAKRKLLPLPEIEIRSSIS